MMTQTEEAPDPSSLHSEVKTLDIGTDPIPSFGALQQARAAVFGAKTTFDSFARKVEALGDSPGSDERRRKGLGYWMIGYYEQAAERLVGFTDDDVASFTHANALVSLGRPLEAIKIFERLSKAYPAEPRPRGGWLAARLEADLAAGDENAALERIKKELAEAPEGFAESAEGHYLRGRAAELEREPGRALDQYRAAREVDPTHRANLFHLAYLAERSGREELALSAYESLTSLLPADRNAMLNLGVLLEDLGRDAEAAAIYDTVVRSHPTDQRARLYLEDARAGMHMFYDEDMERKEDRLNQILRIPITDFELSVRARNCLNKMNIMTLGDLVRKTEAELLSYKNFGETSLSEIKEILTSKSLRLGMAREEAVASIARQRGAVPGSNENTEVLGKPLSELKLSIRARRTVENLGCLNLGDITQHSEDELLGMPNFGVTSLMELKSKLAEFGLKLKGD
jgi:DNA-directed RNA polymerase subunit alpha